MLKSRLTKKRSSMLLQMSNRGSSLVKPDNTSLIVNDSDTDTDELPKEITSVLLEEDLVGNMNRESTSLMKSLTQKTQSTPKKAKNDLYNLLGRKNMNNIEEDCYFDGVLKSCGAIPLNENSSYQLSCDQAVLAIKVNDELIESKDRVTKFLKALKNKIESPEQLQKMLIHTLTAEDCDVARGPVQESLLRILLNVSCLQHPLIDILLEKLTDLALNCEENENAQMISSILRQLRFLNCAKEVKMADRLFEITQIAPISVQREIIFMLPEIVSECETEQVSVKLIDMLRSENGLTNVVVDTVTNLKLSDVACSQVQAKVMSRLDKCPIEFLPSLVQFILSKCSEDEYPRVIDGLRQNLPFTTKHLAMKKGKKEADEDSYIKQTFEIFKFSAMASRQMTEDWIKIISSATSADGIRCLDLVILIIFYCNLYGKKSQILTLIRSKVKIAVLTETHVTDMFKILNVVATEYFSSLLEVASSLIKSPQPVVSDFGALLYKQSFIHLHFYMEQTIVNELLLHVATGTPATVNTALLVLKSLCKNHKEALSQHTACLVGILVKIFDFDPVQTRLLIDIIADLIFFKTEDNSTWQDELQIFIRKQLGSSKVEIFKKGVIAAILLGKHAGMLKDNDYEHTQINKLLCTAMGTPDTCDTKRGFFNDEFSTMLYESNLNESFVEFWSAKIQNLVGALFLRNIDIECEHFPMSLQYSLNKDDDHQLVFPVVDFVISSNSEKILNIPIAVIPSTLRLLWCSKISKMVQPIFSAAIVMPEVTVFDNFHSFDETRKKIIMDCLFLCANYLVECVNAFCSRKEWDKALVRLKQLIKVRKYIGSHIHIIREYTPPLCQFYTPVSRILKNKIDKSRKKGKKRKADGSASSSTAATQGDLHVSNITPQVPAAPTEGEDWDSKVESDDPLAPYEGYFRLLHVNCVELLKAELTAKSAGISQTMSGILMDDKSWSPGSKAQTELQNDDALFLLEDCIRKTSEILGKSKGGFGFKRKTTSTATETCPEDFLNAAMSILPALMKKIATWSTYCKNLLNENEGLVDGPGMYPKESCDIKMALAAAFQFLAGILAWHGFEIPVNKSILIEILGSLTKKGNSSNIASRVTLVSNVAADAACQLAKFSKSILLLNGGVCIIKAVQTCSGFSSVSSPNLLADLCLDMLRRPWFNVRGTPEKGATYNQQIDELLKTYFATVNDRLKVVKNTAKMAFDEIYLLNDRNSSLNFMKSLSRNNFPLLYRAMCQALVSASTEELAKNKNDESRLQIWNTIVEAMMTLVEIVKIHTSRINLAALLKNSQSIIQLFFSTGMPVIEGAFRVNSVDVLKLLKSLQTVTRFLHSICCHSKITSDSLVATYVPTIRAHCERLTLEVKGVLISNKIPMECITIAILKNKDLKGNDILSQESVEGDSDDDSELPTEDNDEDRDDGDNDVE